MAKPKDIDSNITLELGEGTTPTQLANAIKAFNALLNKSCKAIDKDSKPIQWQVQVKKGSNLIAFHAAPAPSPSVSEDEVIALIADGLNTESYTREHVKKLDRDLLEGLTDLCNVPKFSNEGDSLFGDKSSPDSVLKVWLKKQPTPINKQLKEKITGVLGGGYTESGAVEGMLHSLEVVEAGKKYKFAIRDLAHGNKVSCVTHDEELFWEAHRLFNKRVEAIGIVKSNAYGLPVSAEISRFREIPKPHPDAWKKARGILAKYV